MIRESPGPSSNGFRSANPVQLYTHRKLLYLDLGHQFVTVTQRSNFLSINITSSGLAAPADYCSCFPCLDRCTRSSRSKRCSSWRTPTSAFQQLLNSRQLSLTAVAAAVAVAVVVVGADSDFRCIRFPWFLIFRMTSARRLFASI